ncbi:MAG: thioesterase family protein [Verrucomicrobiota bacterium]
MSSDKLGFTIMPYRVPYADTDQMGVVYYANYLVYFERTRNEVLRELDYPYTKIEEEGMILPVIEAHCDYKRPAKYDDLLEFHAWFEEEGKTRVRARCQVKRGDDLLAEGYTIHACLSAETMRPMRLPNIFKTA